MKVVHLLGAKERVMPTGELIVLVVAFIFINIPFFRCLRGVEKYIETLRDPYYLGSASIVLLLCGATALVITDTWKGVMLIFFAIVYAYLAYKAVERQCKGGNDAQSATLPDW